MNPNEHTPADSPQDRYLAPVPSADRTAGENALPTIADERVVHALLRTLAPGELSATMTRVDRAMDALAAAEQERFALRIRRVVAPWLARGAAAAAMLLMAVVVTRMATAPSAAYAELVAITSATQAMPLRRYAVVVEQGPTAGVVHRRHGTIDLGPDERFVARIAARSDEAGAPGDRPDDTLSPEAMLRHFMQDDALRARLRDDETFRERLLRDPALRERTLREMARREQTDGGVPRGPRLDGRQRDRDATDTEADGTPRGRHPRAASQHPGGPSPAGQRDRLRPPRGRFDPHATVGHDGSSFWLVPAGGPVLSSPSAALLQGRIELADGLDQLLLDRILDRLRNGYRLQHDEIEETNAETGARERVVRIVATRISGRMDRPGASGPHPSVVVVRARSADRVVLSFEARWRAADEDGPHRRMVIELLDEAPPASHRDLSWFGHDAHHEADRAVIEIGDEELAKLREMRDRLERRGDRRRGDDVE